MLSTSQDPGELAKLSPIVSSLLRLYPSSTPGTPQRTTLDDGTTAAITTESAASTASLIVSPVFSVLSQTTPGPRTSWAGAGEGEESSARGRSLRRGRGQYRGSGVNVTMPCSGSAAADVVDLQKRLVIPRHIKVRHLVFFSFNFPSLCMIFFIAVLYKSRNGQPATRWIRVLKQQLLMDV
jgi:hypothetical protein